MRHVVAIDASHDKLTRAVSRHRKAKVYPHFLNRGFKVDRFTGQRAQRQVVAPVVADPDVDYLTGVGHGELDRYLGDANVPVFQVGQYAPQEANRKIVHFLSCLTALGLGPDFVTNGTRAFFGYDDNFAFDSRSRDSCLECDSEIDKGFADGLTARAVYQRAFDAFTARINEARRAGKHHIAGTLENNRDHLCAPTVHQRFGRTRARLAAKSKRKSP